MSGGAIFVTGAGGFVGRRLLPALAALGRPVIALDRSGAVAASSLPAGVTVVRGDLLAPESYVDALRGCVVAVHLAAATGKASAADHHRVNAAGTAALIAACQQAGTTRLLCVSSIAVTFADQTGYHYAAAKTAAEQSVAASGLRTTVVRPTMILGPGSPVEVGLAALALLPAVVVPGTGQVRVQPVHVDDLVAALTEIVAADRFAGETLEVGGPDVLAIEALLQAVRVARTGAPGRVVHLPLALLRGPALLGERAGLGAVLPVTAGQLASFANDGTAAPSTIAAAQPDRMRGLAAMLARTTPSTAVPTPGPVAEEPAAMDRECRRLARHLLDVEPDAYVLGVYRDALTRLPALAPRSPFDARLLAWSRRGAGWTRLADAYAALFARDAALRRRLVLVLAILESRAPFHQVVDAPLGRPGVVVWAAMAARGLLAVATTAAAAVVFVPLRLVVALTGRGR